MPSGEGAAQVQVRQTLEQGKVLCDIDAMNRWSGDPWNTFHADQTIFYSILTPYGIWQTPYCLYPWSTQELPKQIDLMLCYFIGEHDIDWSDCASGSHEICAERACITSNDRWGVIKQKGKELTKWLMQSSISMVSFLFYNHKCVVCVWAPWVKQSHDLGDLALVL